MPRRWLKTIVIPFDEFEKGAYHEAADYEKCESLNETDDGCPICLEELDKAEELAIKKAERDGKYEFVDIMLSNMPGLKPDEDRFWEFEVTLTYPA